MFSLNAILAFFLVSMPEEFLMCIGTALLMGKRYVADLTDKRMVTKVLGITFLTALSTELLRIAPIGDLARALIQIVIFVALYSLILRLRWYEVAISFLVYITGFAVLEYANCTLMTSITGITVNECYKNAYLMLVFFLPQRGLQSLFAYIIDKKRISLPIKQVKKFTAQIYRKLIVVIIWLLATFIFVVVNAKYYIFDAPPVNINTNFVILLASNLIYCTVVTITVISLVIHLIKKEDENKRDNRTSFNYFKGLLVRYNGDIIKITEILDEGLATFKDDDEDKKKGK